MKSLLSIEHVFFKYDPDADWALNDVSLEVYEGEWLAIVGHNGSGKSTLAKLMNGLLFPEQGRVTVEGFDTKDESSIREIRKRIGVVFQNPDNQFVGSTVRDDVAFGLENNGVPRDEMIKRIDSSLNAVNMSEFLNQEPHHLSGGQKQRVAIAGVLAIEPSIMILDEATSMLDPRGRLEVMETVRSLKQSRKMTVVSITHDLEEAVRADRIIVMNRGRVYEEGTPSEIFQSGDALVDIGLDLPFSIKLSKKLKEYGLLNQENFLTQEKLVEQLWTLKSNN